ncbi:MAG: HAMP domain-containing protein, partial [Burkholderiaceae bacterium]
MRLRGTFLRSHVARRIFLLFVVSAFLPVAVLAYLTFGQVHELMFSSEKRRLLNTGTAYMHSVYDRLLGAAFVLDSLTRSQLHSQAEFDAKQITDSIAFRRVERLTGVELGTALGDGASTQLAWISGLVVAHLEKGEIAVLPARPDSVDVGPWMARAVNSQRLADGIVVAELEREFLWGKAENLTHGVQVCVFGAASVELNCSDPSIAAPARESGLVAAGAPHQESRDGRWAIGRKALFLRPKFAAPDWHFVTLLPREESAPETERIARNFFAVALLTLLLASFLSLTQIRRTLVPIERLVRGTRRIANEVFNRPVRVQSNDEFGELARCLNA